MNKLRSAYSRPPCQPEQSVGSDSGQLAGDRCGLEPPASQNRYPFRSCVHLLTAIFHLLITSTLFLPLTENPHFSHRSSSGISSLGEYQCSRLLPPHLHGSILMLSFFFVSFLISLSASLFTFASHWFIAGPLYGHTHGHSHVSSDSIQHVSPRITFSVSVIGLTLFHRKRIRLVVGHIKPGHVFEILYDFFGP